MPCSDINIPEEIVQRLSEKTAEWAGEDVRSSLGGNRQTVTGHQGQPTAGHQGNRRSMDPHGHAKVNRTGSILPLCPLPHSRHYVSWSEGSSPHQATPPTPPILLVPGPSLAEEFSSPVVIGHSPVSVRKLLLSVLESPGGPRYEPLSQRCPPPRPATPTATPRRRSHSDDTGDEPAAGRSTDSDDDDDDGYCEPDQGCVLLRSSPATSRRKRLSHRPRSLPGPAPHLQIPPLHGPRKRPSRACETPPPGPRPHPPRLPGKPRCVSLSANLNWLLGAGLHIPFRGPGGATQSRDGGLKPRPQPEAHISAGPRKDMDPTENTNIPDHIFKASCDLEKENAHFIVVDMVLEAVEGAKWAVLSQREGGAAGGAAGSCADCIQETASQDKTEHGIPQTKRHSASVASSDSGYAGWCTQQSFSPPTSLTKEQTPASDVDQHETSTCGNSSSFHSSSSQSSPVLYSAEVLALQLVSEFRKRWSTAEDLSPAGLASTLQEFLPDNDSMATEDILSLADEIRQRSRMRGTLTWAPPRFQIIFSTHPAQKRSVVVAFQHYLCAGCGTQVEAKYLKKLRYCEYLGRYFCDCCHSDAEAVVPGRVLERWDFGRYPVCDFSRRLLDSVWHQPLFSRACLDRTLIPKPRELARFTEVQEQLVSIKKLLTVCRLSNGVLQELDQLPGHLMQEPLLVSMDDLQRVKRGQLVPQARALLHMAIAHVETCQLCQARGFICEICQGKDVLFPFQTETCRRCRDCKACFHVDCFRDEECPKCLRIQTRRARSDALTQPPPSD